ncbi:mercury methylation corrinoid protein HgcA [Nitrospirota bacterium]
MDSAFGKVPRIKTELNAKDRNGAIRSRLSSYRDTYRVDPGLYAVGNPTKDSDVLISANYKLSFDYLRKELGDLDVWVLVIDTNGINVWCAAGKGSFGTEEIINRVKKYDLEKLVEHRRIIVPQLGGPGVNAKRVKDSTGFRVSFGPVQASHIKEYIQAGYKASRAMRKIKFSFVDRLVLTPLEINPIMKRFPHFALIVLLVFGIMPEGILFKDALINGLPFLMMGFGAVFAGAFLTPLFLPFLPSRSFVIKGWIAGFVVNLIVLKLFGSSLDLALMIASHVFFPLLSSFIAFQFTGSTTYTHMSGVQKEMKLALPVYISSLGVTAILIVIHKIFLWGWL